MNSPESAPEAAIVRSNRKALILTLLIFVLPALVAYVLLKSGWYTAAGTSNRGMLINPPIEFDLLKLVDSEGTALVPEQFHKKWWIMYVLPPQCEAACRNSLYQMRQVHQALGPEQERVGKLIISTGAIPVELKRWLDQEFPSTLQASADSSQLNQALQVAFTAPETAAVAGHLYLIDTMGAMFMHYSGYADEKESVLKARDLLKDLQRVLKVSKIG